ncbi:hypothetical protein [Novosphingobium sp.]|uniref:hypothetical protein n=1 Tax=Novosphingobium sp. TaxID=1874826 RepID=UPI00286E0B71|nr:hypothetical protein [Novosphingobium sp.]
MSDSSTIVKRQQLAIRRELDRRGIHLKQVQFDSRIPYPTLLSYFPAEGGREPAMMPMSALYCLVGAIPDDLLSLLMPPGRLIIAAHESLDHDTLAALCLDYAMNHARARHPDSPGGVEITADEGDALELKAAKLQQENSND